MKRVPVLLLVVVLLTGILTGCGNPVESFNKASEKTERVNSAKVKFSSNVNMEFYEDSFTAEEKKELGKYKKVTVQGEYYFDKSKKENLNKINFNLAGKGVDLKIYGRKGETYIVTPLLPKILVIKKMILNPSRCREMLRCLLAFSMHRGRKTLTSLFRRKP
ncbi:hypothetical protein D2962_04995 [Biomaibacter acetigenes]|uniref:Lipoprotein n=1 Tax=Biomaibacter acetigenes TaxID=2316383 RepID=A0A3G2R3K4_9FIRM|nr:hypothetical protein [Biomaibacter acetigenes]AYO30053.1 hypothetical protein D2962_04995 [Biomaibacter acetigenes]